MSAQKFENMTPKEQFKSIQILHLGLISGPVLMFVMLWFTQEYVINMNPLDGTLSLIFPFFVLGAIAGGMAIYNYEKKRLAKNATLVQKIAVFRKSNLLRWSLIEGVSIACLVFFFFMESNISLIFAFTLGLFAMAISRPTVDGFGVDFELSSREKQELN